jgi:hypothetical protein
LVIRNTGRHRSRPGGVVRWRAGGALGGTVGWFALALTTSAGEILAVLLLSPAILALGAYLGALRGRTAQ